MGVELLASFGHDLLIMKFIPVLLVAFAPLLSFSQEAVKPVDPAKFNEPIRLACIGDSITQGSGAEKGKSYPSQLQGLLGDKWKVGNFGVSGRTLLKKGDHPYWKEKAFQDAQTFKPKVVVIMLGTNDTKPQNWKFQDEFASDYKELVKTFQALETKPLIYVCRPCPVPGAGNFGINEAGVQLEIPMIDKLAKEEKLGVIDMNAALKDKPELLPDRVHPNTAGAGVMAETAAAALTGKPVLKQ